ncbi:extracellular solute-binding protein [Dictyobacter formicarum]|uniref:ABC transporter substrate-binding protein n=1 Tax=Dictyobacter formicarum TaxID=2778368 RepID=A0ABQ3VC38_9CHLR|nr:extracellular solute-binding protein [Dictyobacter formicarum]GHO83687.1 ABC transporter substrate-binding protein [Dictyobacter formicarum]
MMYEPGTKSERKNGGRMKRRAFLEKSLALGVGGSAAISLLSACGTSANAAAGVTYWNLFGGGDGARMIQMQDMFTKSHPDIALKAVTLAWGQPYYTKVAMSAAGGRAPDVGICHLSRLSTFAAMNFLDPFDIDLLGQVGITEQNFLPEVWQRATYNGKLYALPLDTHPYVMYYNTDVCKKAGLLDADNNLKPMQGPDQLISAFKAAQSVTGFTGIAFLDSWRLFDSLYGQLGGKILSPDAKEIVLDDDKAEQALNFMADLTLKSKVMPANIDSVAVFGSGKSGFLWNGEWEVTTFITQKTPFNMIPFPNVFGNTHVWGDSHSFILPHQAYPDKGRQRSAYEFMASMLKEGQVWAEGGHIPAYLPVATSDAYKQLKPQSNYANAAADVVADPAAWFSGAGSEFETQANGAFQTILLGQLTPKQGIQQFKKAIQKLINTPSPI